MELLDNLKHTICGLFEVHTENSGTQRIVTPLEYSGSGDRIVIRVRHKDDGFQIDENGEAAFYASMSGGDTDTESVDRWAKEMSLYSPACFDSEDQIIKAFTKESRLIAPYIFRVAESAQQLFSLATLRAERQQNDFKDRVKSVVMEVAKSLNLGCEHDYVLPIAGGLTADHYINSKKPLIIIAATSTTRLLEAEVIHMQYQMAHIEGYVLAITENQNSVGKKQFERANYYTGKTVSFSPNDLEQLIKIQTMRTIQ